MCSTAELVPFMQGVCLQGGRLEFMQHGGLEFIQANDVSAGVRKQIFRILFEIHLKYKKYSYLCPVDKKRCLFTAVLIEVGKAFYGIGNVS